MATSINAMARRLRIAWLKSYSELMRPSPWEDASESNRAGWEAAAIIALEEQKKRKKVRAAEPQRAYTDDELQERFDSLFTRVAALEEKTK